MTDLTPFFSQCVTIYNESNDDIIKRKQQQQTQRQLKISSPGTFYVEDTFNKECRELYHEIGGLQDLIVSMKPGYLLSNGALKDFDDSDDDNEYEFDDNEEGDDDDDDLNALPKPTPQKCRKKPTIKTNFTEEERDVFDSQSNLLVHKFKQKLTHLEKYEAKRSESLWFSKAFNNTDHNAMYSSSGMKNNTFSMVRNYIDFTLKKADYIKLNENVHKHREGMLNSLSLALKKVSVELGNMQSIRLNRKLEEKSNELHLLSNSDLLNQAADIEELKKKLSNEASKPDSKSTVTYNNTENDLNQPVTLSYNDQLQIDGEDDNLKQYHSTLQSLSQQQIKQLEVENSQLLNNKLDELQKVKTLQKSAADIANLQRELSIHVETQAEQIKQLQDDLELAEMDVVKGNKELKSAKLKGRRASLIIIWASIILGFLLLFFDAIIL